MSTAAARMPTGRAARRGAGLAAVALAVARRAAGSRAGARRRRRASAAGRLLRERRRTRARPTRRWPPSWPTSSPRIATRSSSASPRAPRRPTRSAAAPCCGRSCSRWRATGRRRIALLDVGCSAGLNLGVDRWRYRYVDDATGATIATTPADRDPRAPEIACRVLAGARPRSDGRAGDRLARGHRPEPDRVDDAAEVRWLRACLWPHDAERRARFDAAVAIARTQRWPLRATTDAAASRRRLAASACPPT
jgi:hypothetical protein